ncbi:MAG: hypothetical protein RID23_15125 [Roseovarius sp.]
MTLTLLHTAGAHCARFEALRDRIAPRAELRQEVREDWLARAQGGVSAELEAEIAGAVAGAEGVVICTCTTIGPAAERAGAIRVDWPMMREAARVGGPVLLAYGLESTWAPSLALLERALAAEGCEAVVHPMPLMRFWPLFEAGEAEAFAAVVAGEVRQVIESGREIGCVVLAQVSMAGAAELLADVGVPVLASPELALKAGLEV